MAAILPQVIVDTTLPVGWDGVADIRPLNSVELQGALDAAVQYEGTYVIELDSLFAYEGSFVVPNHVGIDWLVIRSSGFNGPEGTRVTDNAGMATIRQAGTASAMRLGLGSHHVRFIGVEFVTDEPIVVFNLVGYDGSYRGPRVESEMCHNVIYDRCLIHSTSEINKCRTGIQVHCHNFAAIDCNLNNIKDTSDAQAIQFHSGVGHLVDNCYLEATGENIMCGGDDVAITNSTTEDLTISRCHFNKRNSWDKLHPEFVKDWGIKNLLELKMAKRVHIHSCVLEHNWSDSQSGYGLVLTVRNQSGGNPWAEVSDVTIENCVFKRIGRFCNILPEDGNPSEQSKRFSFRNILVHTNGGRAGDPEDYGVSGRGFNFVASRRPLQGFSVEHCTFVFQEGHLGSNFIETESNGPVAVDDVQLINNVWDDGRYSWKIRVDQGYITNLTVEGNGIFFNPAANAYDYRIRQANFDAAFPGPGNIKADIIEDVMFVDRANQDYSLAPASPFAGKGVDYAELEAAIDGVVTGVIEFESDNSSDSSSASPQSDSSSDSSSSSSSSSGSSDSSKSSSGSSSGSSSDSSSTPTPPVPLTTNEKLRICIDMLATINTSVLHKQEAKKIQHAQNDLILIYPVN